MPYNMNFLRYPKAEHFDDVLNGVKESFDSTGKPGNITIPASGVNVTQQGPAIVTLVAGFESLDEIDQLQEAVISNPEAWSRINRIASMCHHANWVVSEILSGAPAIPANYEPKVVSRIFLSAKPGLTQDLISGLMEARENTEADVKPIISRPITGPIGMVRISQIATGLQELEELSQATREAAVKEGVPDLVSQSPIRSVGRIVHANMP